MKVKKKKTAEEQILFRRQKCVNEIFEDAIIHLKQQTDNRRAAKIYDMIGPVLKRRKEAMEDRRWIDGFPDEYVDRLLAFGVPEAMGHL